MVSPVDEFIQRLGKLTDRWGWGESIGNIWGILLLSSEAITQDDLAEASSYSVALVSSSLSRLEDLGLVASVGRRGKKRLYRAVLSFIDALENFLTRFVDTELTPTVNLLSRRIYEIKEEKQRLNAGRILEEYKKAIAFLTYSVSFMKKHKDLRLDELQQVLQRVGV